MMKRFHELLAEADEVDGVRQLYKAISGLKQQFPGRLPIEHGLLQMFVFYLYDQGMRANLIADQNLRRSLLSIMADLSKQVIRRRYRSLEKSGKLEYEFDDVAGLSKAFQDMFGDVLDEPEEQPADEPEPEEERQPVDERELERWGQSVARHLDNKVSQHGSGKFAFRLGPKIAGATRQNIMDAVNRHLRVAVITLVAKYKRDDEQAVTIEVAKK